MIYAGYFVNRLLLSVLERKIFMEVWSGKPVTDYDFLYVFGFTVYYYVKELKLDSRAKKVFFMGIIFGVKGFRFWCLSIKKMICNRDVIFDESVTLKKVADKDIQTSNILQQVECILKQVEFEQMGICSVNKFNFSVTMEELEVEEVLI